MLNVPSSFAEVENFAILYHLGSTYFFLRYFHSFIPAAKQSADITTPVKIP